MDHDTFNNDAPETTDEEYFEFVKWLVKLTTVELEVAKGDSVAQKRALCRYWWRGYRANLTPAELIDFLPLDEAGYSDPETEALMQISDQLTKDDIKTGEFL